jgi:hypothetical protein
MLAGVKRYAAYARATGSVGTQYVKQAARSLDPIATSKNPGRRHPLPEVGITAPLPACPVWGACPMILVNPVKT